MWTEELPTMLEDKVVAEMLLLPALLMLTEDLEFERLVERPDRLAAVRLVKVDCVVGLFCKF